MKCMSLLVTSLVLVAVPALAQQGGLPAVQAQINALQAQNASLEQQITGLQTSLGGLQIQIDELSSVVAADDGTAQALVGTWTGAVSSVEFDKSVKFTSPGSPPASGPFFNIFGGVPASVAPTFAVPILGSCTGGVSGTCQTGNMIVGVNPEFWLARGSNNPDPITFTLTRDGMKLSGAVIQDNQEFATLSGIVLSNNFFLLKARAPATGPCAGTGFVVYLGTGSLSVDRTRMLVTGSAIEADCQHSVFRVGLTK
ncbi:MAG: hypothetical protein HYS37_07190 [Candidatus Rokubacteria bacterium]|nr:hypothetical protein [Candidatus Rokubacteria bacterium]